MTPYSAAAEAAWPSRSSSRRASLSASSGMLASSIFVAQLVDFGFGLVRFAQLAAESP